MTFHVPLLFTDMYRSRQCEQIYRVYLHCIRSSLLPSSLSSSREILLLC